MSTLNFPNQKILSNSTHAVLLVYKWMVIRGGNLVYYSPCSIYDARKQNLPPDENRGCVLGSSLDGKVGSNIYP